MREEPAAGNYAEQIFKAMNESAQAKPRASGTAAAYRWRPRTRTATTLSSIWSRSVPNAGSASPYTDPVLFAKSVSADSPPPLESDRRRPGAFCGRARPEQHEGTPMELDQTELEVAFACWALARENRGAVVADTAIPAAHRLADHGWLERRIEPDGELSWWWTAAAETALDVNALTESVADRQN